MRRPLLQAPGRCGVVHRAIESTTAALRAGAVAWLTSPRPGVRRPAPYPARGRRARGLAVWGVIGLVAVLRPFSGKAAPRAVALGQSGAPQGGELGHPRRQVCGFGGVRQGPAHAGANVRVAVSDVDDGAWAARDALPGACERGLVGPVSRVGTDCWWHSGRTEIRLDSRNVSIGAGDRAIRSRY
jgi:hypothetical protein